MRLVGHLLSADARRFRLLVGASLAFTAVSTIVELSRLNLGDSSRAVFALTLAGSLMWLANVILTLLTVPLIVQAHPAVGSDAFWMTRPIGPRAIVASKVALLTGLIVGVPVLCQLLFMATYRVPARDMAFVATDTALAQGLLMVILMSGACLTRSVGGFALLLGGGLVTLAVSMIVAAAIAFSRTVSDGGMAAVSVGVPGPSPHVDWATASLLTIGLTIIAGLALVVVQYQTRSRIRSVPTGLAGLVLMFVIVSLWPWSFFQRPHEVPGWASSHEALQLTADAASIKTSYSGPWRPDNRIWHYASARVAFRDLPVGWIAQARVEEPSLDLPGGRRINCEGVRFSQPIGVAGEDTGGQPPGVQRVLGVRRLADVGTPSQDMTILAIADDDVRANVGRTATYRARVTIDLSHQEIVAAMPLEPGATFEDGASRFSIDTVKHAPGSSTISVRVRRSGVVTTFHGADPPTHWFYYRNRRLGEAIAAHWTYGMERFPFGTGGGVHVTKVADWGFFVNESRLMTSDPANPRERPNADAAWWADAELVIVRVTPAGSVERELIIELFPIQLPEPGAQ